MLNQRGNDARCEDCHQPDKISAENHALHGDRVACATCHIKSVFTCNNCHFDTELAVRGKSKRATGKERDFMMLVNRRGYGPRGNDQVHPATYQSLVYNGRSFYAIAPFFSHTVMEKVHKCEYCHQNKVLQEYDKTGQIVVANWVFLKQNADLMRMLPDSAYPLTDTQLTKLRVPVEDLPIAKKRALIRMGLRPPEDDSSSTAEGSSETPRTSPPKALGHE